MMKKLCRMYRKFVPLFAKYFITNHIAILVELGFTACQHSTVILRQKSWKVDNCLIWSIESYNSVINRYTWYLKCEDSWPCCLSLISCCVPLPCCRVHFPRIASFRTIGGAVALFFPGDHLGGGSLWQTQQMCVQWSFFHLGLLLAQLRDWLI